MNTGMRIDGKAAASAVLAEVADDVAELRRNGVQPGLAVVLVGADPASEVYVRNKVRTAGEVGVRSVEHRLDRSVSQAALTALVEALNADDTVHGILVQMPLPDHLDAAAVIDTIRPDKDVDGFHRENVGGLSQGRDVLTPCTPAGCMHLLRQVVGDLRGKHAVIVGRSNIVGKPMAALLLQADCSVTVLHSRSLRPEAVCRQGDIVVAAVGKAGLIDADWLKPGAVVIDVGINRVSVDGVSKLKGDVDFESAIAVASAVTPVPGGVGPMTIAFLMRNTVIAARKQAAASGGR